MPNYRALRTSGKSGVPSHPADFETLARMSRRGSLLGLHEFQEQVFNGNVFVSNEGTATTPISFAKTTYDADQPQFVIDVPAGITIVPLHLEIVLETEAGTLNEIIWGAANAVVGAGTSTAPTNTRNMLIAAGANEPATQSTLRVLYTANGTDVTTATAYYEFARWSKPFVLSDGDPQDKYVWNHMTHGPAPVIEGTGSLVCWIAGVGTAPTGYLTAVWLELNT